MMPQPAGKTRILFVDDDEIALGSYKTLFRKDRDRWEMSFAATPEAALAALDEHVFGLVISDAQMPRMHGAKLLEKVQQLQPGAIRVMFTANTDQATFLKMLPVAHQFLNKPCPPSQLRTTIERCCALHELLVDDRLRTFIGQLDRLPSTPQTYLDLCQILGDPDSNAADVAAVLEGDPAMSAKILQIVNSAYFGLAQPATSVAKGVAYVGMEMIKNLSLAVHVFGAMDGFAVEGFSISALQRNSYLVGKIAKKISDRSRADEAFTAGLLHDVGRIVLAMGAPEQLKAVLRNMKETGRPSQVVEKEVLGITHAEIGAYLLGSWGLPLSIVEAVAFHHRPDLLPENSLNTLAVVHIADAIAHGITEGLDAESDSLPAGEVARMGIAHHLCDWRALALKESETLVAA
jgi:HD-like signal output (HDOD) protein